MSTLNFRDKGIKTQYSPGRVSNCLLSGFPTKTNVNVLSGPLTCISETKMEHDMRRTENMNQKYGHVICASLFAYTAILRFNF